MPHPKNRPQIEAYVSEADIIYFGGAAGGGKSDLLLGLALTDQKQSIIFRREYKQLRSLIDRSQELLAGKGARYSQQQARWVNIPGDRVLEFGAVQYDPDVENFKGRPHDFIGFDEVTDFKETHVRFLSAWNRTTDPDQRCRIVCAGNPPTQPSGRWVIKFWGPWLKKNHPNKAMPGELRWFATLDGVDTEVESGETFTHRGEVIMPKSRTFIPSFLKNNPYLMATDYYATLQALPEPLRSQLLYGDFLVDEDEQLNQVIPSSWVREAMDRWDPEDIRAEGPITAVGLDPSRGGKDQTVAARRTEDYYYELLTWEGHQVRNSQDCVTLVTTEVGLDFKGPYYVDVIAIGAGVYDLMTDLELDVVDVNFARRSDYVDDSGVLEMRNVRAEAYWRMRDALDPAKGSKVALPPDEELLADLTAPTWTRTSTGITIERKKDIRKRLGRSPGKGDAIVNAGMDSDVGVFFR